MEVCPLCQNDNFQPEVKGPQNRWFHFCENCKLVFEPKDNRPARSEERERYLKHDNSIHHKGYVNYLNRAVKPALPLLKTGFRGLDFGCGPMPTLNRLLEKQGYTCEFYDPIFFPEYPLGTFDFIFATECFEHFFRPANELQKLSDLLNSGGILVVMTKMWNDTRKFEKWRYAHDSTHVVFYHEDTFRFIARNYGFKLLEIKNENVIILQKTLRNLKKA